MFLWARTVLKLISFPSSSLILVFVGALMIKTKYRKSGKTLIVIGILTLYLFSTGLVSNLMMRPLEHVYPPIAESIQDVDAVVVLSSGAKDLSHVGLGVVPGSESLGRLTHGIKIYRRMRVPYLVISGGEADPARPGVSLGGILAKTALDIGVNKDDLILEEDSKNTYEGALNLKKILKDKTRIILVTNARHMERAAILHQEAGFEVIPAPSGYSSERIPVHIESLIPSAGSLGMSSEALYECLSKLWYAVKRFVA